LILVAGAAFAVAQPASAQTVKITTTGTITAIYGDGFNSSVQVGTPFTYSFLFNYSVPDTYIFGDPTLGLYESGAAPYGATFSFGDYGFAPNAGSPAQIGVYYDEAHSFYFLQTKDNSETVTGFSSPPANSEVYAYGQLTDNSILSSDALPPLSIYNLANFHNAASDGFFVAAVLQYDSGQSEVVGTATSLSAELVNPVPEASTTLSLGVMLGLGGLGMVVARRRRSRV